MAKTNQNQVPKDFDALYSPIIKLKKLLMSNVKVLESEHIMRGLIMLHYSSFMMCGLSHQIKQDTAKFIELRKLIELILEGDEFRLEHAQKSKLISAIDGIGKALNITPRPYLYIAMYSAHLDAEVYRHFNSATAIYDFIDYYYVDPDTVARMKNYHDSSISLLSSLGLSPFVRKDIK